VAERPQLQQRQRNGVRATARLETNPRLTRPARDGVLIAAEQASGLGGRHTPCEHKAAKGSIGHRAFPSDCGVGNTVRNAVKFVFELLVDILGPLGQAILSAALLFIAVEAVRWWLGV